MGWLARAIGSVLPVLGRLGKGKATVTGVVGVAAAVAAKTVGVPLLGGVITDQNIVELVRIAADVAIALFAMIGSFGAGRKAGFAAAKPD